jgi:hypothetical protein
MFNYYLKNLNSVFLTCALTFISIANAQEVRVIDNKGTIKTVRNNQVSTSATAPVASVIGDVWFDTSAPSMVSKIYDNSSVWKIIDQDKVTTSNTAPAIKNIGDFWLDTSLTPNTFNVWDENSWISINGQQDTQDLSIDATGKIISLVNGGNVIINPNDADADATNELSDLSISGSILTLSNPTTTGNSITLPNAIITTITNTAATGNKIADYTNENGGAPVAINETITSLTQDNTPTTTNTAATGEITFSDENGNTTGKAQVVSADDGNKISVGTDGGAFSRARSLFSVTTTTTIANVNFDPTTNQVNNSIWVNMNTALPTTTINVKTGDIVDVRVHISEDFSRYNDIGDVIRLDINNPSLIGSPTMIETLIAGGDNTFEVAAASLNQLFTVTGNGLLTIGIQVKYSDNSSRTYSTNRSGLGGLQVIIYR